MFVCFCFQTGSLCSPGYLGTHFIDLAIFDLQRSACLCFLNTEIKRVSHLWYFAKEGLEHIFHYASL